MLLTFPLLARAEVQCLHALLAQGTRDDATVALAGTYHNLLRMWADA